MELKNIYQYLCSLNEHNFRTKMLYSLYLKHIENDDFEAFEVNEQFNSMRKNLLIRKNEKDEYDINGSNSHASVIMISGSKHNLGEVLNANNELSELLGYSRDSINGGSINRLMPGIIGADHDRKLMNYIIQNKEKTALPELIVMATHKNGIMVPCILKKRIIPNLHQGIQFIGFLCKCNDITPLLDKVYAKSEDFYNQSAVLFLTDSNWRIHGINDSACQLFNINPDDVNIRKYFYEDEKFTLTKIFPKFSEDIHHPDSIAHTNIMDSEMPINIALLQTEISTSIDKILENKEDSTHLSRNSSISTMTVRVYDHIYESYESQNVRLAVLKCKKGAEDIIKVIAKEEEKSSFMYESAKGKDVEIEIYENQSQSSSSVASSLISTRTVKDLKNRVHSQQWTTLLLIFMRMGIVLYIILNILGGICITSHTLHGEKEHAKPAQHNGRQNSQVLLLQG